MPLLVSSKRRALGLQINYGILQNSFLSSESLFKFSLAYM